MKKRVAIIILVFTSLMTSCVKDPIINTPDKVGTSRITYFPKIELTGSTIVVVAKGSTFTEPGVKATAGTASVPVTTSGTVNTAVDGVYTLTYNATNADGFSSTAVRTIVVYTTAEDATANDLSGTYLRAATGVTSIWTKLAPGVYRVQNPGGAASGTDLVVIAINPVAYKILIPEQKASDGSVSSSKSEIYTPGSPASYKWIFLNPTYGTGSRTFVKQ